MAKNKEFEKEYKIEGLRRAKLRKENRKRKIHSSSRTRCKCGNEGTYQVNPYYQDMNDQIIMECICPNCYSSYCGDI